jgi:transposase
MIGLPTLSQLDGAGPVAAVRIWLAARPADMRCGFDRLAELAGHVTGQDPFCGHLFLFRSRGGDRLKVLYWDKDGLALWYKRLEEGTFKLPRIEEGATSVELRPSELAMLLDGIDLKSVKRVKRYSRTPPPASACGT